MYKKGVMTFIICLMSAVLFSGCGRSDNDDTSDKLKNNVDTASEQEETSEDAATETGVTSVGSTEDEVDPDETETPKGVPNLLLFRDNAFEWREDNTPAISQHYSYLLLDGESAASNPKLAASLEDAKAEMFYKRKETWNQDLKSIKESELISFNDSWMAYLRRADDEYLSFVFEYSSEGLYDDGAYTEYFAHSYYVNDGKEIVFSDVVVNEDAFFDLITDKMYESIDDKLNQYYSFGLETDKEAFKKDLKGYLNSGELAWTLDPFGVTCYLQAYTAAPFAESATILFSEDSDKTIFNDEFRESARDEYVIQVPGYVGSYIDINDSGVPAYVKASEQYDYSAEDDEFYLSGLYISSTGDWKNIQTTMPGGTDYYNIFLLHKDGTTVLFENHDEYDQSFINTYILARHEVTEADNIRGCLEWSSENDYDINGAGYTPVYVPTDPSSIRVLTGDGQFAGDWSPTVLNIDAKGKIK